jgi:hypothetical protein
MDNRGRIVGYAFCGSGVLTLRAVAWIDKKPIILPGGSMATAINDRGDVFGRSDDNRHGVVWKIRQ